MLLFLATALVSVPQDLDRSLLTGVVEPYLAAEHVPGVVVALVVDGRPGPVEAFGLADLASERPMTRETRFQVGSVTKPFTATLVALLADDGALDANDPFAKHLPPGTVVPEPLRAITLLQLGTHTSGLPREPVNRVNLPDTPSVMVPMSVAELLDGLATTELEGEPGAKVVYSNLGYALLGAAVAGDDYPELLRERVLAPLGMTRSGVFLGDDVVPDLASCYWPEDAEPVAREPWRFESACAFSGLVSTGGDLARFVAAQMEASEDALLSPGARELLFSPHAPFPDVGGEMGFGWFVTPLPGGSLSLGHGGEVDGHSACIAFLPELRFGLVVLANRGGDAAEGLIRQLMEALLPRLMAR